MVNYLSVALFLAFTLAFLPALAQQEPANKIAVDTTETGKIEVGEPPKFPGGKVAMTKFINQNLEHPKDETLKEGSVLILFLITKEGNVKDPVIIKGLSPAYNQAALKLVSRMPKWIPSNLNGEPRDAKWTFYVPFYKNQKTKTKYKTKG